MLSLDCDLMVHMRSSLSLLLLAGVLPFVCHAARNPKPHLRVAELWFIEEPASSAFSFFIFGIQIYTYWIYGKKVQPEQHPEYPFHWLWRAYSYTWMFGYMASTLFHLYETKLFERLDYFGAVLGISFMTYSAIIRVFGIISPIKRLLIAVPFLQRAVYFVYYMLYVKFDYGWAVNLVIQSLTLHAALWLPWSAWMLFKENRHYCWYNIVTHLIILLFAPFELYDFVPIWRIFDGHSLWHAGGMLISYCWGQFQLGDALWALSHRKEAEREYFDTREELLLKQV